MSLEDLDRWESQSMKDRLNFFDALLRDGERVEQGYLAATAPIVARLQQIALENPLDMWTEMAELLWTEYQDRLIGKQSWISTRLIVLCARLPFLLEQILIALLQHSPQVAAIVISTLDRSNVKLIAGNLAKVLISRSFFKEFATLLRIVPDASLDLHHTFVALPRLEPEFTIPAVLHNARAFGICWEDVDSHASLLNLLLDEAFLAHGLFHLQLEILIVELSTSSPDSLRRAVSSLIEALTPDCSRFKIAMRDESDTLIESLCKKRNHHRLRRTDRVPNSGAHSSEFKLRSVRAKNLLFTIICCGNSVLDIMYRTLHVLLPQVQRALFGPLHNSTLRSAASTLAAVARGGSPENSDIKLWRVIHRDAACSGGALLYSVVWISQFKAARTEWLHRLLASLLHYALRSWKKRQDSDESNANALLKAVWHSACHWLDVQEELAMLLEAFVRSENDMTFVHKRQLGYCLLMSITESPFVTLDNSDVADYSWAKINVIDTSPPRSICHVLSNLANRYKWL